MVHKQHRDFETYSAVDLPSAGAWRYAADSTTGVYCVAYAVDDGSVNIWLPGQPIPPEFLVAAECSPKWLSLSTISSGREKPRPTIFASPALL